MPPKRGPDFPCSLLVSSSSTLFFSYLDAVLEKLLNLWWCSVIYIPFPSERLASAALRALRVDQELSPLVQRDFSTVTAAENEAGAVSTAERSVLRTEYKATTNRMLRVAVNGFMESLDLVIGVMEELDLDVLEADEPPS
jgi:EKC/KEOPS complex subunit PCC1/LAGE3